jgi:hypothetical protein
LLEGWAKEDNGRVAVVTGAIYNEEHVLLAEVEAVLSNIPQHLLASAALGPEDWKVFPDEEEAV